MLNKQATELGAEHRLPVELGPGSPSLPLPPPDVGRLCIPRPALEIVALRGTQSRARSNSLTVCVRCGASGPVLTYDRRLHCRVI